jgi:hypothetical protein
MYQGWAHPTFVPIHGQLFFVRENAEERMKQLIAQYTYLSFNVVTHEDDDGEQVMDWIKVSSDKCYKIEPITPVDIVVRQLATELPF